MINTDRFVPVRTEQYVRQLDDHSGGGWVAILNIPTAYSVVSGFFITASILPSSNLYGRI